MTAHTRQKRVRARIIVGIGLCIPLVVVIGMLASLAVPYVIGGMSAERVASFATASEEPASGGGAPAAATVAVDWDGLLASNPDTIGWIYVPDTAIDYAIVQARSDYPQRYLYYDFYGSSNYHGCPYVAAPCEPYGGIDSLFPVIYGHHLIDGTMFSDFAKYGDRSYAEAHRTIYVYTPTETRTLRVVAANVVNADYESIADGFETQAELAAYIEEKLAESEVVLEQPEDPGRVYALICCSYQGNNSRTIVYAVDESVEATNANL